MTMNISIIGGGLSGIFAARTLRELGHDPTIIEKSRSVGGRMATRRIENGRADHGAQFFTVRSTELQQLTEEWLENKWVERWFGEDYPRYRGTEGMNSLVKKLAEGLPLELEEKVLRINRSGSTVSLTTQNDKEFSSDAVIVTAPVPQALQLLHDSSISLPSHTKSALESLQFKPCFVGLLTLNESISIGKEGIISSGLPHGVDKIVANDQKGISPTSILSVYMTGDWSSARFEEKDEDVLAQIVDILHAEVLSVDQIARSQLKRWRFAEATQVHREPFLQVDNLPIFIAGDSFLTKDDSSGRTRVESAILSGMHVGKAVAQHFYN
ncbi:deoxyribodipyrimidine photolyase [Salipaludibacillus keqinensis]|uniref:Deoxyribodipyrimidine photolyase n=1 Tax=Salipaludibacillus keqinensis TaxID=2045207 RepID=A0A323TBE4_9BACI|nr:FAD-dependent oxidoreductase [Salipaludibacillus keqinensis]PYZ92176.1 deoxyribodipyrimidine photolyase [Salipaludibacillus keqinensis]